MLSDNFIFILFSLLLMGLIIRALRQPLQRLYHASPAVLHLIKKHDNRGSHKRQIHSKVESLRNSKIDKDINVFKDNRIDNMFWQFSQFGPGFSVNPGNISFLQEPDEFYDALLEGIRTAKKRVTLASLYLGSGQLEVKLTETISEALEKNKQLQVTVLLDGIRGKRGGKVPTSQEEAKQMHKTSINMLLPTVMKFPDRMKVTLYHTPDLRGFWKKVIPNTYNESLGVSHIKAYIWDDDIIMSGANLSNDYFTNRQDRYIRIVQQPTIVNYFDKLIQVMGSFCYILRPDGEMKIQNSELDVDKDHVHYRQYARSQLEPFLQPRTFYTSNSSTELHRLGKHIPDMDSILSKKTWIFPSLQMAPLNLRHDEILTSYILSAEHDLSMASPYLNLTKDYIQDIVTGHSKVEIITASPESNGWYKAKGLASQIQQAYTLIEKQFYDYLKGIGQHERITLREYVRNDWTFHGKGLWATLPGQDHPYLVAVGSPNFGGRSVDKDLEGQMIIMTEDEDLREKFNKERGYLWNGSRVVDDDLWNLPSRQASKTLRFMVSLAKNYL